MFVVADKRVNPSADSNSPIRWASRRGHAEVVKLLLKDKRVDPSVKNQQAFSKGLVRGHTGVLRVLLTDERTIITNQLLCIADGHSDGNRANAFFDATHPRIWPR